MIERFSKKRKALLIALENIIGECHNPHSATESYAAEKGSWFNYPVTFVGEDGKKTRIADFVDPGFYEDGNESVMMNSYYAFGANRLLVYRNLDKVLKFLETECGLEVDKYEPDDEDSDSELGEP